MTFLKKYSTKKGKCTLQSKPYKVAEQERQCWRKGKIDLNFCFFVVVLFFWGTEKNKNQKNWWLGVVSRKQTITRLFFVFFALFWNQKKWMTVQSNQSLLILMGKESKKWWMPIPEQTNSTMVVNVVSKTNLSAFPPDWNVSDKRLILICLCGCILILIWRARLNSKTPFCGTQRTCLVKKHKNRAKPVLFLVKLRLGVKVDVLIFHISGGSSFVRKNISFEFRLSCFFNITNESCLFVLNCFLCFVWWYEQKTWQKKSDSDVISNTFWFRFNTQKQIYSNFWPSFKSCVTCLTKRHNSQKSAHSREFNSIILQP